MTNQTPPADIGLESSVLIGAIYRPEIAETVIDRVTKDWFYSPQNMHIFASCLHCYQKSGQIDARSVANYLEQNGHDGASLNVLAGLNDTSSLSNIETHLEILENLYLRRRVILLGMDAVKQGYEPDNDGVTVIETLSRKIDEIRDDGVTTHSMTASEVITDWQSRPSVSKLITGDDILDHGIYNEAGLHPGHMEVTIAHSGHGKTRYAIYKAAMLAKNGIKTHWFQLEDYGFKTASMFAQILNPIELDNIIITDSIFEIEKIKREARISSKENGVRNIVIDYVQNLSADKKSRAEDVEYISRQLTRMAIDLSVQVHLMSQLTIQDSQRKKWNLEPRASDVRWSRQLQQDAHMITSVFRPSRIEGLYDDSNAQDWNGDEIHLNSVYIKQLKSRYGEPYTKRYHMIDTDTGLRSFEAFRRETEVKNNAHRNVIVPTLPEDEDAPF